MIPAFEFTHDLAWNTPKSVAVPGATITEAILLRAGSIARLYNALLVEDNMVTKMNYVQERARSGGLDDVANALTAVRRTYGNNPLTD